MLYSRWSPRSLSHASRSGFVGYRKVIVEDPSAMPITAPGFSTRRISLSAASGAARCWGTAQAKAASNEQSATLRRRATGRMAWREDDRRRTTEQ